MPLPTNRAPTHPGEILAAGFLAPLGLAQVELAADRRPVPARQSDHPRAAGRHARHRAAPRAFLWHDARFLA